MPHSGIVTPDASSVAADYAVGFNASALAKKYAFGQSFAVKIVVGLAATCELVEAGAAGFIGASLVRELVACGHLGKALVRAQLPRPPSRLVMTSGRLFTPELAKTNFVG